MKRKIISLLLMAVLCLNLAVNASAADIDFITDSLDLLTESDLEYLNDLATEIYDNTGVAVYYLYESGGHLPDYNVDGLVLEQTDYYVMLENEDSWYYFSGGKGDALDTDTLRAVYDDPETYVEGVEAYLAEAYIQLIILADTPVESAPVETVPVVIAPVETAPIETEPVETQPVETESVEDDLLIWDDAELLTNAEIAALDSKLLSLSQKYQAEIRVVTLSSMEGGNIDEFLEFLYDELDFGYGENHDGVLLLVCMDPREYRILSNGFAGMAITSSDIDTIGDAFVSDLSDGNYADAFETFADQCDYYLDGYINGFPFDTTTSLLTAVGIGLLVAVIGTTILKGQLKSVYKKDEANAYVKAGTMQITQSGDFFLYREVTKTEKKESSSSGSSGGSSRSTGGGSF